MEKYEIYIDGSLVESCSLRGIAFMKFDTARLVGDASLFRIVEIGDPVIDGRFQYDFEYGEWVYKGPTGPPCPPDVSECKYRQPYVTPGLQKNALRVEIFSPSNRCGWSLKDGRVGGHPDDYHVCRRAP